MNLSVSRLSIAFEAVSNVLFPVGRIQVQLYMIDFIKFTTGFQ